MKSKHYIVFLLIAALWIGCRPNGILSSRQMREVLVDLHKADAILQVSGMQHGYDEDRNIYYATVLERHGITQSQFDSSLVWYTANPQLFDKIYPKVLAELESERDLFIAAHKQELGPQLLKSETTIVLTQQQIAAQIDSILWVSQHGYPSLWNPYRPCIQVPTVLFR